MVFSWKGKKPIFFISLDRCNLHLLCHDYVNFTNTQNNYIYYHKSAKRWSQAGARGLLTQD